MTLANPGSKSERDIFRNISQFLDHFIILIFAKAAYDAGNFFWINLRRDYRLRHVKFPVFWSICATRLISGRQNFLRVNDAYLFL